MHPAARLWVRRFRTADKVAVLDVGSHFVNGRIQDLFPNADYVGLDLVRGDGVDIVADAATWEPDREYDIVVSTEVLEHAEQWRDIIKTCWRALKPGGLFIMTAAGPGRPPHGAYGATDVADGEWYENIEPDALADACGCFSDVSIDIAGDDIRLKAVK